MVEGYTKRMESYEKQMAGFKEATEKAKAEGKPAPKAPNKPMMPSCLYNGMIANLIPYGIKGAVWYQGESNASRAKEYQTLFPSMIKNWREDWGQYPTNDVDLILVRPNGTLDFTGATLNSPERVTLTNPPPGNWIVLVDGFSVPTADKYDLRIALNGKVVK